VLSGGGARGAAHIGVLRAREALGATANYTKWDAAGTLAHSFGPHTFTVGFRFGGKLGSGELPGYDQFQWGGFLQQSGLPTGALYGGNIAFGRLVYYNRLLHLPFLEGRVRRRLARGRQGRRPVRAGEPDGHVELRLGVLRLGQPDRAGLPRRRGGEQRQLELLLLPRATVIGAPAGRRR